MFEKVINILIVESVQSESDNLLGIIAHQDHNIFIAKTTNEAFRIINEREIVIVILDLDMPDLNASEFIKSLGKLIDQTNIIVSSRDSQKVYDIIEGQVYGAVDYLLKPWIPNLVLTKIGIYKKLHFKNEKVSHLLENILPEHILNEFNQQGKSTPQKHSNATVFFSDFVKFTEKTRQVKPQELVKLLDHYFSHFDEVMDKYHLEKIKTIGDAYMAIGGVTENQPHPVIRTALAALEIQNFILNEILTNKALSKDFWEIRIGMHTGDLVAGIVGTHKFSYDVWGDTVNVAARCEQTSEINKINISEDFYVQIEDYFECTSRGEIAIKNRGNLTMYSIDGLKKEYSFYGEGRLPNIALREKIELPSSDFKGLRSFILNKMKAELPEELIYHSYHHTLNVEKAVLAYAKLESLTKKETILVRTAAIFHDTGFILRYKNNESIAASLVDRHASEFGYSEKDIQCIKEIILATSFDIEPKNLMEQVMCDADHDYLGRPDYHKISEKLFAELEHFGKKMTQMEKLEMQIDYLETKHKFYTLTAMNLRRPGKLKRIVELKEQLSRL